MKRTNLAVDKLPSDKEEGQRPITLDELSSDKEEGQRPSVSPGVSSAELLFNNPSMRSNEPPSKPSQLQLLEQLSQLIYTRGKLLNDQELQDKQILIHEKNQRSVVLQQIKDQFDRTQQDLMLLQQMQIKANIMSTYVYSWVNPPDSSQKSWVEGCKQAVKSLSKAASIDLLKDILFLFENIKDTNTKKKFLKSFKIYLGFLDTSIIKAVLLGKLIAIFKTFPPTNTMTRNRNKCYAFDVTDSIGKELKNLNDTYTSKILENLTGITSVEKCIVAGNSIKWGVEANKDFYIFYSDYTSAGLTKTEGEQLQLLYQAKQSTQNQLNNINSQIEAISLQIKIKQLENQQSQVLQSKLMPKAVPIQPLLPTFFPMLPMPIQPLPSTSLFQGPIATNLLFGNTTTNNTIQPMSSIPTPTLTSFPPIVDNVWSYPPATLFPPFTSNLFASPSNPPQGNTTTTNTGSNKQNNSGQNSLGF